MHTCLVAQLNNQNNFKLLFLLGEEIQLEMPFVFGHTFFCIPYFCGGGRNNLGFSGWGVLGSNVVGGRTHDIGFL